MLPISQTEVLLLGQCVGEFETAGQYSRFLDALRRKLEAYVPDFGFLVKVGVAFPLDLPIEQDLLARYHLVEINDNWTLGASRQQSQWILEIPYNKAQIEKMRCNREDLDVYLLLLRPDRKSLVDLLFLRYGDCLSLSPGECLLRQISLTPRFVDDWENFVERFFESRNATASLRSAVTSGKDDLSLLAPQLEALAKEHESGEAFATGRLFGALAGVLQSERLRFSPLSDDDSEELSLMLADGGTRTLSIDGFLQSDFYTPPIGNSVLELLKCPMVQETRFARELLESLLEFKFFYTWSPEYWVTDEPWLELDIQWNLDEYQQRLSAAFGALLAALDRAQDEFESRQFEAIVPRTFQEACREHPDAVMDNMIRISRMLETPCFKPKDAVAILIAGVEGLTRRVWPCEANRDGGVGRTLREKASSPRELERRFAIIGMGLWQGYRNAATHKVDFTCSFHEARHYLSGIRAMVDLAKRIEAERKHNN